MHGGCTFIPDDLPRKCVPGHSQILCPGLPYALADKDDAGLLALADIVTRARTAVERDFQSNPAFAHDLEMPTRLAKQLVQVARGAAPGGTGSPGRRKRAVP